MGSNVLISNFIQHKVEYLDIQKLGVGNRLPKLTISAGEHNATVQWSVSPRPQDNGEYLTLAVAVLLNETDANIPLIFEVFFMGKDGLPSSQHSQRSMLLRKAPQGFRFDGWWRFIKLSELESHYVINGMVTIMCGLIILRNENDPIAVPPSNLADQLGIMVGSANGSDISFLVGGEMFHAHRAVLAARSPVFHAELFGHMAEAIMPCVTLYDMEPATFRALLHFIYTDALPPGDYSSLMITDFFISLLAAADRFALDRLKLICAQNLLERLTEETFAATLGCADTYNCMELKNKCFEYFLADDNLRKIVATEGYIHMMYCSPSVFKDIQMLLNTSAP